MGPRGKKRIPCVSGAFTLFSAAVVGAILNVLWFSGHAARVGMVEATYLVENEKSDGGAPAVEIEPLEPRRRVAVCFFGLTRSLRWTLPSIERRLLGVLRDSGMQVEVFLHTYDLLEVGGASGRGASLSLIHI